METEKLVEELEELRRRELNDEPMSTDDYRRWNEISELLLQDYETEAKKYDKND